MLRSLSFQDPFNSCYPKGVEKEITDVSCLTMALSKCGQFLAAGCMDSSIIVYDLQVYSRVGEFYSAAFKSLKTLKLKFNHDSSLIAGLYSDGQVAIWNCSTKSLIRSLKRDKVGVAFFDFCNDELISAFEDGHLQVCKVSFGQGELEVFSANAQLVSGCLFGDKILLLTEDSRLLVFDVPSRAFTHQFTETDLGGQEHNGIFAIECREGGTEVILSGKNRVLRIVSVDLGAGKVQLKYKLQDAVDKYNWKCTGFSNHSSFDASFTFASAGAKGKHLIYLWENSTSNMVHKIEGPKEESAQVLWSPIKPQLYSLGAQSGKIYIFGPQFVQKWASLVPNIEALETNIEYIEREDEFDLSPEDEISKNREHDESIELDLDSFRTPIISVPKCTTLLFPL